MVNHNGMKTESGKHRVRLHSGLSVYERICQYGFMLA